MGKFAYAVLMVFVIELALYIFGGQDIAKTSLFGILFNPLSIFSNPLYLIIIAALGLLAVAVIIPGSFIQINIYALYSGIVVIIIAFVLSIAHLYGFIFTELEPLLMDELMPRLIAILITSPFIIYYLIACVEWIRSNT